MRRLAVALCSCRARTRWLLGGRRASPEVPARRSIDDIVVGADANGSPTIEFPAGRDYTQVQTRVEWEGDGDVLVEGGPGPARHLRGSPAHGRGRSARHIRTRLPRPYRRCARAPRPRTVRRTQVTASGSRVLLVVARGRHRPRAHRRRRDGRGRAADARHRRAAAARRTDLPIVDRRRERRTDDHAPRRRDAPDELVGRDAHPGRRASRSSGLARAPQLQGGRLATTREVLQSSWPPDTAPWGGPDRCGTDASPASTRA